MKPVLVLQHVPHESLGALQSHLRDAGLPWRYVELFRETPDDLGLDAAAGLVVLGGPMNVDEVEKHPFLRAEIGWIRDAVAARVPLLGICLGAQLLAKAMGARVFPNSVKEIGWYEIDLTTEAAGDWLFGDRGPTETVFQWHGDTFDPPPGAVLLARGNQCAQQAFRFGPAAYGLQFHVEMTPEMVADWLADLENRRELAALDYIDPEAIRRAVPECLPRMQSLARRVLPAFAAMCRDRA
jgi:GMP synthase (glutamine-hydrolysing)